MPQNQIPSAKPFKKILKALFLKTLAISELLLKNSQHLFDRAPPTGNNFFKQYITSSFKWVFKVIKKTIQTKISISIKHKIE